MAITTRSTLKGYFNTGDKPTESNFADLIDSSAETRIILQTEDTNDVNYSSDITTSTNIFVNAAMACGKDINLPEATTANGGMHIKVVFGIAALDAVRVGFVTTKIQGGATAIGDTNEGNAPTDIAAAIADNGDNFLRIEFDLDTAARAGATGGTELNFYYFGEANKVMYRGHLISEIDDPTLASHFSTTAVNA